MEALRQAEKSPTTNDGYELFMQLRHYLLTDYFYRNPTAERDMQELGRAMFGDGLLSSIFAKLLQGDRFGKLE
jgi:hypothetical protein